MHLGSSSLVLYPLLFAASAANVLLDDRNLAVQVEADAQWDNAEVMTHMELGERLHVTPKPDAWLRLRIAKGAVFNTPIFHFEHKKDDNDGKAQRKAVLLAQLTWRRIFVACSIAGARDALLSSDESHKKALEKATNICNNLVIWFASLEGTKFRIGALKGNYQHEREGPYTEITQKGDKTVVSYARFEYAITEPVDVVEEGTNAMLLMYALARHLPHHVYNVNALLPDISDAQMKEWQEYSKATTAGSKKRTKSGRDTSKKEKGKKPKISNEGGPSGTKASYGFVKKDRIMELLGDDVTDVQHMWSIPGEAYFEKTTPFDGDHIFTGTWKGDTTICQRGASLFLKAFSGEELDDYDNEVEILKAIPKVPNVQKMLLARKADHIAVIVSPLQPTTASDIKSLEGIKEVGQQVLKALVELRRLAIIHRDVKPTNILWSAAESSATLIDFGLATKAAMERTSPKGVDNFPYRLSSSGSVGTDGYQAPEILANCSYDEKIDVYSLGKTLENIASEAGIQNNSSLEEVVGFMTMEDPSERCTAQEALGFAFFQ